MEKKEVVLSVKKLSKTFHILDHKTSFLHRIASIINPSFSNRKIEALKDINFEISKGEFFGVIGRNGSGKSTLIKLIMGSMIANKGSDIFTKGRMIRLALGMGFDINLTARDNIYLNGVILGMTFKEIGNRFDKIIEFAELEKFVDTPIRFFSSGMRSRLAFSIAIHADADIFLIDEFFGGVGDESFKAKSKKVFRARLIEGKTILFVSHSMESIKNNCDRLMVINKGVGQVFDDVKEGIAFYESTFKKPQKVVTYG